MRFGGFELSASVRSNFLIELTANPEEQARIAGIRRRLLPNLVEDPWFAWTVGAVGVATGLLLWIITLLISRSDIHGHGWSLAGNGALIVPFGVGPAVVAAGWAAIILRLRGHPRWLPWGMASGLVGLFFVACSLLSLALFGAGQRDAGAPGPVFFGLLPS